MYTLFTDDQRHYGGKIEAARFRDVEKKIVEDVDRVVQYYRNSGHAVKSEHLLCRLIGTMNVPLQYELDRYYEVAVARYLYVANSLRLTSSIQVGAWHQGVFYRGSKEIILTYHEEESPLELMKNWRDLQAVKVLTSPVNNLRYMLPDGHEHNTEQGLAVIGIDLPKLMIQYRGFYHEQRERWVRGESQQTTAHFVMRYVLPNMLYSQTDQALLNRLMCLQSGEPMGESLKRHPFYLSDYSGLLDKGLNEVLTRISTVKMDYRTLLSIIPSIFHDRPYAMPDIAETRQVWWALFIARFQLSQFLWEVGGEPLRHYNQTYLNALKIDIRRLQSENVFKGRLPEPLYDDLMYFIRQVTL